jgi:hypothetical protein
MPKMWKSTMPALIKWERTLKLLIIEGETPGAFSGDGNGKIKLHQNQAHPIEFLHELMHKIIELFEGTEKETIVLTVSFIRHARGITLHIMFSFLCIFDYCSNNKTNSVITNPCPLVTRSATVF